MSKVIQMSLSSKSIDQALRELRSYRDSLESKKQELLKELANIGLTEAQVRFTNAMYDGANDSEVTLKTIEDGYVIVAEGHAVAFIEFGTGVYYNPTEPYPKPRPDGIVGIGEYGHGRGKRQAWGFKDESGELVITHGNPAAMPMWYASEKMRDSILSIARRVFGK